MRHAIILLSCAWVLWAEHGPAVGGGRVMSPTAAFADGEQACEADIARRLKHVQGWANDQVKITLLGKGYLYAHTEQPGVELTSYTCLPDTIDPRGPKR